MRGVGVRHKGTRPRPKDGPRSREGAPGTPHLWPGRVWRRDPDAGSRHRFDSPAFPHFVVPRSILSDKTSRNLFFFLCLNLSFAFVELLYGIWSNW